MQKQVRTYYLDYQPGADVKRKHEPRPYDLRLSAVPCPELNRFLYVSVGHQWCWHMRLPWSRQCWLAYLEDSAVVTWVGYDGANPVGYFELRREPSGAVEIAYLGLMPSYVGRGLGKALLQDAIAKASAFGNGDIWLHTCSLDHPAALPNYLARGFKVRNTVTQVENLPDAPLELWPGALA